MVVAAPYPAAPPAAAAPVAVAALYPAVRQAAAVPAAAVAVFLASAARAFPRCAIRECIAAGLQGAFGNQLSYGSCPVERPITLTGQKFRAVPSNSMWSHRDLLGAQPLSAR